MRQGVSRRTFIKAGMATAATAYLGTHLSARVADAAHTHATLTQPTFTPLPSESPLGTDLVDISQAWDGTLWAIDANGVPHALSDDDGGWTLFGRGIDAIAYDTSGEQMVFRGGEYLSSGNPGLKIADTWPTLPYSFRMGVDGAANVEGTLYLFRHGRYVSTEPPLDAMPTLAVALNTLTNWPKSDAWTDGLIDAVGSQKSGSGSDVEFSPLVLMFLGDEYLVADMSAKRVVQAPRSLIGTRAVNKDFGALASELVNGFDGLVIETVGEVRTIDAYQGMKHWVYRPGVDPALPGPAAFRWREDWSPFLAQAPSGRVGALWALSNGLPQRLYRHDGDDWEPVSFSPPGQPVSISAGADGLLHVLTSVNSLYRLEESGEWTRLADAPMPLAQVAVGDKNSVFVRDQQGNVHRYVAEQSQFVTVDTGAPTRHITASADGTLWHTHPDQPSVFRKVTDATKPSEGMSVGQSVDGVRSVTTTGFGSAYLVADTNNGTEILSFESPVLMKTPGSYDTGFANQMATGAGYLFVSVYTGDGNDPGSAHACIDAQTGLEQWRVTLPTDPVRAPHLPESVFDPVYHVIYLAMGRDIAALDVHTGDVKWRYTTDKGALTGRPALAGNLLCFVTDQGAVFAFDTAAAQRGDVEPLWTWSPPGEPRFEGNYPQPPLIVEDNVVVSTWATIPGGKSLEVTVLSAAEELTEAQRIRWSRTVDTAEGVYGFEAQFGRQAEPVYYPPISAQGSGDLAIHVLDEGLVVGWDRSVHVLRFSNGDRLNSYYIPDEETVSITSGVTTWVGEPQEIETPKGKLGYNMPICVFGTSSGTIYAIQSGLSGVDPFAASKTIWGTPFLARPVTKGMITTTPFLRSLNSAAPFIHFGLDNDNALWTYDPSTGDGARIETGATVVTTLAPTNHGVVYVGGDSAAPEQVSQYFAVRLDDAIFHDFLVESHLLEDYDGDENDTTHHTRYQTHVTILDQTKAPRPNQPVKIWSDEPTTVQVDGVPHDVGPVTPVHFQTDGTGSFTLTSEADSTRTSPLRLHAGFMDDFERIVIYPDREFHGRLAEAQAEPDGQEADLDDPQRVNLSTAKDFGGAHLCDPATKQAEHTKSAVVQTMTAVGFGGGQTALAGQGPKHKDNPGKGRKRRTSPKGQDKKQPEPTLDKYIAYATTPGLVSLSTNTPAYLLANIAQPTGFVLEPDSFTPLTAVGAAAEVDRLEGDEVDPGSLGAVEVGGFFKNLWHFIHSLKDKIKKIAVSIGKVIYAGIQWVVDGVEKVVRVAIKTISDIASMVGAFFVKLGKDIAQVIQALTILFHLDRIIDTAKNLRDLFTMADAELPGVVTQGKQIVDKYFEDFESTIDQTFEKLIEQLRAGTGSDVEGTPISGLSGMGATAHTTFTVGPHDGSSPPKSHATQCTWGAHKFRHHYKNSTPDGSGGVTAGEPDPFTTFITNFLNALESDPELKDALNQAKTQFHSGFKAGSATDFLESAVEDLLELLKVIIVAAVAVVKAFVLAVMDAMADSLKALGEFKIPILSPLWKAFGGHDLTFLDIVTFIMAIPITIVYRIVDKAWPPKHDPSAEPQVDEWVGRVLGLAGGLGYMFAGWLTAVNDAIFISGVTISKTGKVLKSVAGVCLLIAMVTRALRTAAKDPTDAHVVLTITAAGSALAAVGGAVPVKINDDPKALASMMSTVGMFLGIVALFPIVEEFVDKETDVLNFSAAFAATIPALVNPLKLLNADTLIPLIVPVVDIDGRGAAGALTVAETIMHWDEL